MSEFTFTIEMPIRFRDIDAMDHVNNAVYATYVEQARVQYFQDVVGRPFMDIGGVIANLDIDFRQPIDYEHGTVEVAVRAAEVGTSSVPLEYEIRTPDGVAATAETLFVAYDRDAGESVPLPEQWREAITEFEGL